jgi:hypothetical protein
MVHCSAPHALWLPSKPTPCDAPVAVVVVVADVDHVGAVHRKHARLHVQPAHVVAISPIDLGRDDRSGPQQQPAVLSSGGQQTAGAVVFAKHIGLGKVRAARRRWTAALLRQHALLERPARQSERSALRGRRCGSTYKARSRLPRTTNLSFIAALIPLGR